MKKDAGISTMMVTGLAAFVSIFVMVLLVVLRGTIGGSANNEQAIKEAADKYEVIRTQFVSDINGADINVYWDRKMTAAVFIGSEKFSVIWKDRNAVFQLAMLYEGENLTAEEKEQQAKDKVEPIVHGEIGGGAKTLGTMIHAFYVETGKEESAILTVKINYADSENKQQVYEQELEQPYNSEAISYRASHK